MAKQNKNVKVTECVWGDELVLYFLNLTLRTLHHLHALLQSLTVSFIATAHVFVLITLHTSSSACPVTAIECIIYSYCTCLCRSQDWEMKSVLETECPINCTGSPQDKPALLNQTFRNYIRMITKVIESQATKLVHSSRHNSLNIYPYITPSLQLVKDRYPSGIQKWYS